MYQHRMALACAHGSRLTCACGKRLAYTRASWKDEKPLEDCAPAYTLSNASVLICQQNSLTNFLEVEAAGTAPEPAPELSGTCFGPCFRALPRNLLQN